MGFKFFITVSGFETCFDLGTKGAGIRLANHISNLDVAPFTMCDVRAGDSWYAAYVKLPYL